MKRSTCFLLALVAVLLLVIFFWEKKQPSTAETSENEESVFTGFPANVVKVERTGRDALTIEKKGGEWVIMKPFEDSADSSSVDGYIESLRKAKAARIIKAPPPPDKLGLTAPGSKIVICGDKGEQLTLELGASPPLEKGAYFRAGGRTGIMDDYLLETMNRKNGDFRSRDLAAPLKPSDVKNMVHLRDGRTVVSLQARAGRFFVTKPYEDEADDNKAYQYIEDAVLWPVMTFDGEVQDPASVGLASPKETIEVETSAGKKVVIALGEIKDKEKNFYYASVSSRKGVFTVSRNSVRLLDKDPEELRSLSVFPRDLYTAEKIEISGKEKMLLSNNKDKGWQIEGQKGEDEDARTVVYALTDLKGEKALPLEEKGRLFAVFSASTHEGTREARFLENEGRLYAARNDRKVLLLIPKDNGERLKAALAKLEEKKK